MMLSTLLLPRRGVMKFQVGCTTVRPVRDNKSIKTTKNIMIIKRLQVTRDALVDLL